MSHEKHEEDQRALSTRHLTKEFVGFEVESKWQLLTENPVPTMLQFTDEIHAGHWGPVCIAKSMGKLPVGLRYFELQFDFWAIQNKPESPHYYHQVAMVAVAPNMEAFQVAFKEGGQSKFLCSDMGLLNPPLIRHEERKGNWVKGKEVTALILGRFPRAEKVATITRQKCYAYVHNLESCRNFSISADLCRFKSKTLSQVEVEYKGRNGVWLPDISGHQIALDFLQIHRILRGRYGGILVPTTKTKFEWITGG